MTVLPRARFATERMDRPDADPIALDAALDHVAGVNRWLGATRALLRHLPEALPASATARVLDVGTGSGDLPVAIAEWARRHDRPLDITAVDLHERTLAAAASRTARCPAIRLARADALQLPFATAHFDLSLLSMTLHHMDGEALVQVLAELGRVARGGRVLVGELERSLPNYIGARLLASTLWRRNPITRHDGPLSVLRAFTPAELLDLARSAGLVHPRVHRHLFYRLVLVAGA